MKSRAEAVEYAKILLKVGSKDSLLIESPLCYHFGMVELRSLFDFIYEGIPQSEEEELNFNGRFRL